MKPIDLPNDLPGWEFVAEGFDDFLASRITIASCLISIAEPRLRRSGLTFPEVAVPIIEPERLLYRLLRSQGGDAYSRYNALLRRLVSLEHSIDRDAAQIVTSKPSA